MNRTTFFFTTLFIVPTLLHCGASGSSGSALVGDAGPGIDPKTPAKARPFCEAPGIAKTFPAGEFPSRYRELLIATGCLEAEEAVQSTLGNDLTRPDFWNKSLDVVEQRVAKFLELAEAIHP